MIDRFREEFRRCLLIYHNEITQNEGLLSLMDPLYALADKKVYENWQVISDMRYQEVSHLIACMGQVKERDTLVSLAEDLTAEGYDAQTSLEFEEKVISELNLVEAIAEGKADTLMAVIQKNE